MIINSEIHSNIWKLAWPATLRMLFQTSVGIITLILVGNYLDGAEAIAAIGLAQRIMFLVIGSLVALGIGTTAIIAHQFGAGNTEDLGKVVSQSLLIGFIVSFLFAIGLDMTAEKALTIMMVGNSDPQVILMGSKYIKIVGYCMVPAVPLFIINAALQGIGDMKTPMYFTIGMNLLNIFIGIILIPGIGPIPSLGLGGAGFAEGLSRSLGGVISLILLLRGKLGIKLSFKELFLWQPEIGKNILKIGLPAAGEQIVRQSSQIIYTVIIATLGTVAIAANQIVMTIQSISFMPGFGFGLAATTLVGQALGAGENENAVRYGYETNKVAMIFMGFMGSIFFVWARPLVLIFVKEPEIVDMAASCLRIIAIAQIPFAIVMVLNGGLRGAGDTRWVMYLTTLGQYGIRLVLSFIFVQLGFGLLGVWVAMGIDMAVRSILTLLRFRSDKWKDLIKVKSFKKQIEY